MKLSTKTILPIILISALLILLVGCFPIDESPGYTEDEGEVGCEDPIADAGGCYCKTVCPDTEALINLSGSGSGTGVLSYAWDLDDDGQFDDSTEQNPQGVPFGVGIHTVTLRVTDDCGSATAITSVEVTINDCINTAPKVGAIPTQAISAEGNVKCIPTYKFTVSKFASDDEEDNLKYSFVSDIPAGMTINPDTGEIVWDPYCVYIGERCHQCGDVCVTVRVQDDGCCGALYTDVLICIGVFNGPVDGTDGELVGIGFDGGQILDGFCD